jgi:signal transduction histidine kinase
MKSTEALAKDIFDKNLYLEQATTDRFFFWLFIAQWLAAVLIAVVLSPFRWEGDDRVLHVHLEAALLVGGAINFFPFILIRMQPGWWMTRHVISVAQMLWSALLIDLTGGRIETHFHIFVSLAFLAFYRDPRIFITATIVVTIDHLVRGFYWPESIYGVANPEWWRFLEHGAWVLFEDAVLILWCTRSLAELRIGSEREARLERVNEDIEQQVHLRTEELTKANGFLAAEMKVRLQMEAELRQAQKLESVGRMASGVAHEINTPVQFIGDSVHFLREATDDLIRVVSSLQRVQKSVLENRPALNEASEAAELERQIDLPYLLENVPKAFDRSLDGLDRVTTIVRSMKEFAHPDSREMEHVDLNRAIENTLIIARNEYKYIAEIETTFGELPQVMCYAGEFNQVILNLIVNATHAIEDVVKGTSAKGRISICTRLDGGSVVISIADSGGGIPEEIREQIFDPFFTTKEIGKGTGQGLSIARSVVVDKHQGELTLESTVGKGTTFFIRLPVEKPKDIANNLKVAA